MSMKHTPGPWSWSEDGYDLRPAAGYMGASLVIATTEGMLVQSFNPNGFEDSMAEVKANKALMAAAPDMLAALIVAREFISADRNCLADCAIDFDGCMSDDDAEVVADYDRALLQIDAAIQKSTGGQA